MRERVGVMDLGTNTFHLLIAEIGESGFTIVHRDRRPVKIGKGGINRGVITQDAIDRALACMIAFREKLDEMKVVRFRAVGTSALRDAENGGVVLEGIRNNSGIEVEVISGQQEAEYIYYGVRIGTPLGEEQSVIVDIGGGSVEFIIGNSEAISWKTSLDIGAQRLLELYHQHDPMTPEELESLDQHYRQALAPVIEAMDTWKPKTLVGSSGTFDTLSEIYCVASGLPYSATQPETPLTVEAFLQIHQQLILKDRAGRMQIPGMIEMRVDMIVVASCLIQHLIHAFHFHKMRVSSYSLKEGVLATLTMPK